MLLRDIPFRYSDSIILRLDRLLDRALIDVLRLVVVGYGAHLVTRPVHLVVMNKLGNR